MKKIKALILLLVICMQLVVIPVVNAQSVTTLTVETDGYNVILSGVLSELDFINNQMTIQITDKETNIALHVGDFHCMQTGEFTYKFSVNSDTKTGVYNLKLGMFGYGTVYDGDIELEFTPDTPEEPDDDILFIWKKKSDINTIYPDMCDFYLYEKNPDVTDVITYSIDSGEEKNTDVKEKFTLVEVDDLTKGMHTISLSVKNNGTEKYSYFETFAVIEEYTHQFMDEFNVRGAVTHYSQNKMLDTDTDLLTFAGIHNIRDEIKWNGIESKTEKGVFDFTKYDEWVNGSEEKGINVLSVLGPCHLSMYPIKNRLTGEYVTNSYYVPRTQNDIDNYNNYVQKVMQQYSHIDKYEIWNEPNGDATLTAADYTDLAANTAIVIKKENRFADINALSLHNFRYAEWANENFSAGIYPYMTGVSFHPYGDYESQIKKMRDIVEENGGWKDLCITEYGCSTNTRGDGFTEESAAIHLVKESLIAESYDVTGNYWYDFVNDGTDKNDVEHNFGVVTKDRTFKKGYFAYSQLNQRIAGAILMGEITLGNNLRAYVFLKDNEPLMVIWSSGADENIVFDTDIEVEDIYGNRVDENSLTISKSPLYISGISEEYIKQAVENEIEKTTSIWKDKYSCIVSSETLLAVENAFSKDVLSADITDAYKEAGLKIIAESKKGQMTEKQASSALYGLYKVLREVVNFSIAQYNGEDIKVLVSKIDSAIESSNQKYFDDFYMMQYSEEILRHAKRYYDKAEFLLNSTEKNPMKNGVISGYDTLSEILISWFEEFSEFETKFNYGLMIGALPDSNSYIDIAKYGEEKELNIYIVNKTDGNAKTFIKINDSLGNTVYENTKAIELASGENKLQICKFSIDEEIGKNVYTAMLFDEQGNTIYKRDFEILVYDEEESGYPSHDGKGDYNTNSYPQNPDLTLRAVEHSDEKRVFYIRDRRFVLLDEDEEGNMFVSADEVYGTKGFNLNDETDENTLMLQESGTWTFNPDNSNNIASWLNGTFLLTGNGGKRLPYDIISSIIEKDWAVEGAKDIGIEARNVKCKVSLMSATEWMYYSDRLGYAPFNAPYAYPDADGNNTYRDAAGQRVNDGWWLRTPMNTNAVMGGFVTVYNSGRPGSLAHWSVRSKYQHRYIRPVFWLDKDFFKNTKIDITTSGEIVDAKIAENNVTDLLSLGYTESELISMGKSETYKTNSGFGVFVPENVQADIYVASYSSEGKLLSVEKLDKELSAGVNKFNMEISGNVKIFTWHDETIIPITKEITAE